MKKQLIIEEKKSRLIRDHFLLLSFIASTILFWFLPILSSSMLDLTERLPNQQGWLMMIVSYLLIITGYFIFKVKEKYIIENKSIYSIAKVLVIILTIPAIIEAINIKISRAGVTYLDQESISYFSQVILYSSYYAYFIFLCTIPKKEEYIQDYILVSILAIAPRFLVSLGGGRFVLFSIIFAFLLIGIKNNFIRLNKKKLFIICTFIISLIFIFPIFRGENIEKDGDWLALTFIRGGPINLLNEIEEIANDFSNVNFLKTGLLGNIFPIVLNEEEKVDLWNRSQLPITADRAFAINEGAGFSEMFGPGSVYIAELYLIGGWIALIFGSLVVGYVMKFIEIRAKYSTIWFLPFLDIATKIPFIPRSNFTYLFERLLPLIFIVIIYYAINYIICNRKLRS